MKVESRTSCCGLAGLLFGHAMKIFEIEKIPPQDLHQLTRMTILYKFPVNDVDLVRALTTTRYIVRCRRCGIE